MTTAPSLLEVQRAFSRSVFANDTAALESWVEPHGLTAGERLQIYRNMVFNTLSGALKTSYPSVLRLVGTDCFDGAAARYIANVPSPSGNLQDFGQAFPDFLATMPETVELPYLADIAQLEWARQASYLAAEARPIALECLTSLEEEELAAAVFTLHPSAHLIDSQYPILDIWHFCQKENQECLQLGEQGQAVLVWRKGTRIEMQAVSSCSGQFITGLLAKRPLGTVVGSAGARDPRFDLSENLSLLLQNNLLVGIHIAQRKS